MLIKDPQIIWNSLKGIICVYKPADVLCKNVRASIIYKICTDLNQMECRPPIDRVEIGGDLSGPFSVKVVPNLADDVRVVGPRYQMDDMACSWANFLGKDTSGVLLLGLRTGTKYANYIRNNKPSRTYRVSGKLGKATDNSFKNGKVVERSTWRHVRNTHMDTLLSAMQSAHQKKMFELCGVDLQSQLAYDLAIKGLLRPTDSKVPVIYGMKCVNFEPPDFTIEIQCINESEMYLKTLIHEIGVKLKTNAHCTGLQCIRHSCFTLDDALLKKHWNLQDIITNHEHCEKIMKENNMFREQANIELQAIKQN